MSLEVCNTGPQLDNETLAELLEPFRRGTRTRLNTPGASGSGLGLSIVRAITTAHGGALTLSANPDGGLTAHVQLSADDAPAETATATGTDIGSGEHTDTNTEPGATTQ